MEKNKKIGLGVVGVIILIAVFYGGMVYGGNNVRASIASRGLGFGQNTGSGMMRGNRTANGFTIGQIISKDATSITVQLVNGGPNTGTTGGSKIVFLDNNTKVTKSVDGTLSDLAIGTTVSITGTPNTDGSVSAQSVQIRPNIPTPTGK